MIVTPASFVAWDAMRTNLLELAHECPSFLLDRALKQSAAEFFRLSRVWRSERFITLLTTAANTTVYSFTPEASAELVDVHEAWHDDLPLGVLHADEGNDVPAADTGTWPPSIRARPTNKLVLSHVPGIAAAVIKGVVSYQPSATATGIPVEAWQRWQREIVAGAALKLYEQPQRPWSISGAIQYHRDRFFEGIAEASMSAGPTRRAGIRSRAI